MLFNFFEKNKKKTIAPLSFTPTEINLTNQRHVTEFSYEVKEEMIHRATAIAKLQSPADIRRAFIDISQGYRRQMAVTPDEEVYQYYLIVGFADKNTKKIIRKLIEDRIKEMDAWYDLVNDDIIIANTWLPTIVQELEK